MHALNVRVIQDSLFSRPETWAAIATVAAVLVALFGKLFSRRFLERSRLEPEPNIHVARHPGNGDPNDATYFRLGVLNNSSNRLGQAKDVVVTVESKSPDPNDNFIPAPLEWTHRGALGITINPNQRVMLDICRWWKPERDHNYYVHLRCPTMDGQPIAALAQGNTTLLLRVSQDSGVGKQWKITVSWPKMDKPPQVELTSSL